MKIKQSYQQGHALITLLFFVVIATIVTSAAVVVLYENSMSTTRFATGTLNYYSAESGIENAILRLLRNPSYTGETLTTSEGNVVIQAQNNGDGTYTILSTSTSNNSIRRIQVDLTSIDNVLTVTSWREIY